MFFCYVFLRYRYLSNKRKGVTFKKYKMDLKLEEDHGKSETSTVLENGEDNENMQVKENEGIENLENKAEQPVETNSELVGSQDVELAQEQENNTRKDSKLVESSKLSFSHGIPKRYLLLFLVFLGFVNIYGLRVNLNVALVAMVNNRTYTLGGVKVEEPAEFHWNSKTQGNNWGVKSILYEGDLIHT